MKKLTFTLFALLFLNYLHAEIHYTAFADRGWVIELNENVAVDIDQDGLDDFFFNSHQDELGVSPIFAQGCFAGTGGYTSYGAQEMQQLQLGNFVHMNSNPYFIEGDRGSFMGPNGEMDNWPSDGDQYIGFMVWITGQYGWMRISIDEVNQQLIIKEWAINDVSQEGITVGDAGDYTPPVGVNDLSKEINSLSLFPNPATTEITLNFNYDSDETLQLIVVNSIGVEIYRETYAKLPNQNVISINTSQFADGMYLLQLRSRDGVRSEAFVKH